MRTRPEEQSAGARWHHSGLLRTAWKRKSEQLQGCGFQRESHGTNLAKPVPPRPAFSGPAGDGRGLPDGRVDSGGPRPGGLVLDGWHQEEPLGEAPWHPQGESRPRNPGRQEHLRRRLHVAQLPEREFPTCKTARFPSVFWTDSLGIDPSGPSRALSEPGFGDGYSYCRGVGGWEDQGSPPSDGRSPSNGSVERCPEALGEGDPLGEAQG